MPRIEPFRALRYAPSLGADLARLIAPPYDVVSPQARAVLASHPRNIVHVDLPAASGIDPYTTALRTLEAWRREGILVRDPEPAFYLCEQEFVTSDGPLRRRRGLFVRLRLEPLGEGTVIPHERTLDGPRADRRRLLEVTRTHLSPVFMLHPDPKAEVSALLARLAQAPHEAALDDGERGRTRLWRVAGSEAVARLTDLLRDPWALIADGHHRYESALEVHRARPGERTAWVLAYLCSLEDPGVVVLPIHRLIHSIVGFDAGRVRERLAKWFDLERVDPQALPAAVAGRRGRPGVFGLVFGGEPGAWLALWRDGAGLDLPGLAALPAALRSLDVVLLHRLLLEQVLGVGLDAQASQKNLEYVKGEGALLERAPTAQIAVLLNPTGIDQVVAASREGLRLPQKSTYFHPKVPTGLVLDPIDD